MGQGLESLAVTPQRLHALAGHHAGVWGRADFPARPAGESLYNGLWLCLRSEQVCTSLWGFRGGSAVKNQPAVQGQGFSPWVGKTPWRRAWQPTPVLLPGKPHGQRSLVGYSHEVAKSQT